MKSAVEALFSAFIRRLWAATLSCFIFTSPPLHRAFCDQMEKKDRIDEVYWIAWEKWKKAYKILKF
jgi:hypothetical protein